LGWPGADGVERDDVSRETVAVDGVAPVEATPAGAQEAPTDSAVPDSAVTDEAVAHEAVAGEAGDVPRETVAVDEVAAVASTPAGTHEAPTDGALDQQAVGDEVAADVSRETEPTESEKAADAFARVSESQDEDVADIPAAGSDTPLAQAVANDTRKRITLVGRELPRPRETRVLTVANQKGGVGKTTTTVNVAAALAQAGATVLVIDLDPQGNASTALGIDHHAEVPSIYDVLVDGDPMREVVQPCPDIAGLYCAPATIDLAGAEIELVSLVARESRLQRAINTYLEEQRKLGNEPLDYILIDCPPSLGLLTVNAFVAAREVLIPIQCEYYALEGLSALLKNIELIRDHLNPALHVSTILLTMFDGRTRLSAQVADEVRNHFPDQTLKATVPRSVRISEAPSHGQTVMTYDPNSSGALSYLEAASEMAAQNAAENSEDHS
jgi:chromosome partitioning protein